jgi:hypothetical protein
MNEFKQFAKKVRAFSARTHHKKCCKGNCFSNESCQNVSFNDGVTVIGFKLLGMVRQTKQGSNCLEVAW